MANLETSLVYVTLAVNTDTALLVHVNVPLTALQRQILLALATTDALCRVKMIATRDSVVLPAPTAIAQIQLADDAEH